MAYSDFYPAEILTPYVERYVVVDMHIPDGHQQTISVLPSSTSQLAINLATANVKPDDTGLLDRHYSSVIVGPFTRRHDYVLHGHINSVVAYFTPTGIHSLLGINMLALADQTIDFSGVNPTDARQLVNGLQNASTNEEKAQQLESYFLRLLPTAVPVDPAVSHLIKAIRNQHGKLKMTDFLTGLKPSQRTLERLFRRATGLTPKQFSRITRFISVRSAIVDKRYRSWYDVLYEGGYYDQAHFIREFTVFTGQTPSAYFASDLGFDNFLLNS